MSDASIRHKLQPKMWKLYRREDMGLLPDGQVWRYIEDVEHEVAMEMVKWLERFVDPANYDSNSAIRYGSVENPFMDGRPREGIWRHLRTRIERVDAQRRVGADGSNWRVVQELAEGYLSNLPYNEARLINYREFSGDDQVGLNPGAKYAALEWRNVDPDQVESLVASKPSTSTVQTYYRKVARNDVLGNDTVDLGTGWHHLYSEGETLPDGSGVVRWFIGDPEYRLDAFSNYNGAGQTSRIYLWNVPEAEAQGILDAYQNTGKDVTSSYDERSGLTDLIVDGLDFVSVDSGWKTYTGKYGTIGQRVWLNATPANLDTVKADLETRAAAGDNTSLNFSPARGMPGYFNVTASYNPSDTEYRMSSGNWADLGTRLYDFPQRTLPNSLVRPRTVVKVSHHSVENNAFNEYETASTPEGTGTWILIESFGGFSAGVRYMGQNKWRAVRIAELVS